MSEPSLIEMLKRMRFLEDAAPDELRQLASAARLEEYDRGALLFREGQRLACIMSPWLRRVRNRTPTTGPAGTILADGLSGVQIGVARDAPRAGCPVSDARI